VERRIVSPAYPFAHHHLVFVRDRSRARACGGRLVSGRVKPAVTDLRGVEIC